jgi:GT2 family glycosyltransferase
MCPQIKPGHIDVIVVNWNGRHFLPDCLDSILGQTYPNKGIIVVDNGSDDGSVEYIRMEFGHATILPLNGNHGFAGANNRGIGSGSGEFVALLNNDAVAHPDWLKESVESLRRHPDAGFCAAKIVDYYRRDILDTAGDIYTRGGVNAKRGVGLPADTYDRPEYVFGACAAAVVYRREMLEEIGLFDEDFFIMCEDVDLSFRAQLAGYTCIYNPLAVVYHKTHGTIGSMDEVFSYYGQRNVEYVYFKNMPLALLLFHLPVHIMYNALILFHFALNGQMRSLLRAKVDFLRTLPATLRKRAYIQKNRRATYRDINSLITGGWLTEKIKSKCRH